MAPLHAAGLADVPEGDPRVGPYGPLWQAEACSRSGPGEKAPSPIGGGRPGPGTPLPWMVEISDQPGDLARAVRFAGGEGVRLLVHRGRRVQREPWWEELRAGVAAGVVGWVHVRVPFRGSRRPAWRRARQGRVEAQRDHDLEWEREVTQGVAGLLLERHPGVLWSWERPPDCVLRDLMEIRQLRADSGASRVWTPACLWGGGVRRYMELEGTLPWLVCIGGQCRGGHRHVPLRGGAVARAQRHPARFCDAMARGWMEEARSGSAWREGVGGQPPYGPEGPSRSSRWDRDRWSEGDPEEIPWGPIGVRGLVGPGCWERWKIAVANRWNFPAHINVLELYAETIGMSWVLRKGTPRRPRLVVILQDSQVAVFSGTKGRSSSLPLLLPLRRTAALLLAGNLYVDRLWIPSKANPADGPSRGRAVGVF